MPGGDTPSGEHPPDATDTLESNDPDQRQTAGAELAHKRAVARSRRQAQGRARSARRLEHEPFTPPPGWRHRPALDGCDVLVDQAVALEHAADLLDAERFRGDRHRAWSAMLAALVHHMDWETGLATVTRDVLAAAGGVDVRTVTTMLRWARGVGLLAVVEAGATAQFLGATHNRAQTYAVTVPAGTAPPAAADEASEEAPEEPGERPPRTPSDLHGDTKIYPPTSYVRDLTLEERLKSRKTSQRTQHPSWPLWQVPETPAERSAAAATLAARIGLEPRRCPMWRLRTLLACWWAQGACVAGLLHAADHHPDHPDHARGDALRGARDPLRVLGHRLRPWQGRLTQLPGRLHGLHGDYRGAQAERLERLTGERAAATPQRVGASPAVRAGARAAITAQLAERRRARPDRGSRP